MLAGFEAHEIEAMAESHQYIVSDIDRRSRMTEVHKAIMDQHVILSAVQSKLDNMFVDGEISEIEYQERFQDVIAGRTRLRDIERYQKSGERLEKVNWIKSGF